VAEVRADRADAVAEPVPPAQVSALATRYPARLHSVLYSKLLYAFLNTTTRPFDTSVSGRPSHSRSTGAQS
jgi:hypothetical protein